MQVNMIFGFLGSGKTTLLRHLLGARAGDQKLAVIVNEFGSVGIDGAILEGEAVDMIQLTSGCLCCTLKGPLLRSMQSCSRQSRSSIPRTLSSASTPSPKLVSGNPVCPPNTYRAETSSIDLKYLTTPLMSIQSPF